MSSGPKTMTLEERVLRWLKAYECDEVSLTAHELLPMVRAAVEQEREAAARIADEHDHCRLHDSMCGPVIAREIRARK